ncbi:MAG TPA: hypothetical protein VEA69_18915 [Tepidisphaeraceae bacterium]|nr:hypothetical protein [Tepidisphaeraceae bacterium]
MAWSSFGAPNWYWAILLSAYPLIRFGRIVRHGTVRWWRLSRTCCLSCGYDLRESPGVCRECGALRTGGPASS